MAKPNKNAKHQLSQNFNNRVLKGNTRKALPVEADQIVEVYVYNEILVCTHAGYITYERMRKLNAIKQGKICLFTKQKALQEKHRVNKFYNVNTAKFRSNFK